MTKRSSRQRSLSRPIFLSAQLRRSRDRLEVRQRSIVIMGSRGVEHNEIELAVDDRTDHAALPPQLVAVEMFIVELEAVGAEERARRDRQSVEIDSAPPN